MKSKILLVLTIVLGVILVACTGASDSSPALSQSIESGNDDGVLTVNYPDGWFAEGAGGGGAVVLANNEEDFLASADMFSTPEITDEDILINISFINVEEFSFLLDDGEELTANLLIETFIGLMDETGEIVAESITINDENAALATLEIEGRAITAISKVSDGNFILLFAMTSLDERDGNQDLFKSILGSTSYAVAGN